MNANVMNAHAIHDYALVPLTPQQAAAQARTIEWVEAEARSTRERKQGFVLLSIFLVLGSLLFIPMGNHGFDVDKKAMTRSIGKYVKYKIPCMAPDSSFLGRWVRTQPVNCSKLSLALPGKRDA